MPARKPSMRLESARYTWLRRDSGSTRGLKFSTRNPYPLTGSDQVRGVPRPLIFRARFLQPRFGFLSLELQADAFFHHLDLAPEDALGAAQPRGCLIERSARGSRVGAFDG